MPLLLSIIGATLLGVFLLMAEVPGFVLAFGIVVGCLFRALYLLHDIRKRLPAGPPRHTKVEDVVAAYLKERDA